METQTVNKRVKWPAQKAGLFLGGTLFLAGTWYFLFLWIMGMTEGWLVPWDVVPGRPPLGTWQRTVNDFFEHPPGAILPAVVVITMSASIFVVKVAQARRKAWLPLTFAATNLIFMLADTVLAILAHQLPDLWLPKPRPPIDVGYHRTWPALVLTVVLLAILFLAQAKVNSSRDQDEVGS
jgi:hypothetical protein